MRNAIGTVALAAAFAAGTGAQAQTSWTEYDRNPELERREAERMGWSDVQELGGDVLASVKSLVAEDYLVASCSGDGPGVWIMWERDLYTLKHSVAIGGTRVQTLMLSIPPAGPFFVEAVPIDRADPPTSVLSHPIRLLRRLVGAEHLVVRATVVERDGDDIPHAAVFAIRDVAEKLAPLAARCGWEF